MVKKINHTKRKVDSYTHRPTKRVNKPPVGLVTPDTNRDVGRKGYTYHPHLDPGLQWVRKTERPSFEVATTPTWIERLLAHA